MRATLVWRVILGAIGVALGAFGLWSLLRIGVSNLANTVGWLAAGVILHDFVLSVAIIGLVAAGAAVLRPSWRGPAAAWLVIVGTVTIMAIPVLGRFGERPDNPTLLDRNYWVGWLVFVGLTTLGVLAVGRLAHRHGRSR